MKKSEQKCMLAIACLVAATPWYVSLGVGIWFLYRTGVWITREKGE